MIFACPSTAQVKEPYRPLHGGTYSGPAVRQSPDPLIRYEWAHPSATDSLEIYRLRPKTIKGIPESSFKITPEGITVLGPGDLFLDFGVESAGWLEFDSDDLQDSVTASISEYNQPAIVNAGAEHRFKTRVPAKYGHRYRLELNKELYEGVRFGDEQMIDRTGANRRVMLLEEYVRFDADNDGIAERLCVHRVGNTVLRIEPTDYQPFVIYCPFPMPGRIAGHSLADKVTDIQRVNTALMRLYLDGQYMSLAPRMWVPDECVTENTYDDLLTVISGTLVRGKGPNRPEPLVLPNDGASALQAIEFMIGQRESRTGITRLNQGLDADTLNKTATGTALLQAQGQQIEEYLARNFGEAVSKLMRLKLRLYSRYGQQMQLRVDGEYRPINPQDWPEDMQTMIRVGLGSGRKDQRLQNRMMLLQIQRECMLGGLPIVTPEHIYKSVAGVVKDANLGSPADFVDDPESPEVQQRIASQPPQPDPEMAKIQGQLQMQAAQMQMQHVKDMGDSQLKLMEIQGKMNAAAHDTESQAALQQQKNYLEAHLAVRQQVMDATLARMKMDMEMHAHASDQARKDAESQAKVKSLRSGGALNK